MDLPIVSLPVAGDTHGGSLLAHLLRQQQTLTAVETFAAVHSDYGRPAQEKHYSSLLPASPPQPGQQYAFEVDLDCCSGCKACVTACHSLNGLDESETWRDVGTLVGGTAANPLLQHVTTACHHCIEPACMQACPVDAYEKDPVTGIVKHLDDQCFGCQYCTLACPYDVPKYHAAKGIVRKCDMCSSRLAVGEAPACVQACPHQAIAIRVVDVQEVIDDCEVGQFLPGAPDPHLTLPTTTFKTRRVFPRNTLPADFYQTSAQHPHWPLIVMLVLTQLSVGAFSAGRVMEGVFGSEMLRSAQRGHALVALSLGLLALAASLLHLGRPQYAFRALIGLRHSWLSREILAFSVFAGVATAYAAGRAFLPDANPPLLRRLEDLVVLTGIVAVLCSVMIYVRTRREFWSFGATTSRFFLSGAVLGLATLWLTTSRSSEGLLPESQNIQRTIITALVACTLLKLGLEASLFRWLWSPSMTSWKRAAQLHIGPLSEVTLARFACGLLGGVFLPLLALRLEAAEAEPVARTLVVVVAGLSLLSGEFLERYLFFAASAGPRMPGAVRP
jgi:Fe-S-cluster-containing dehydrogenase component/DMSO reductase anchor subunit